MIQTAEIQEWRDHDVIDATGHKVGVLEGIYVNTATDEPAMATVRTGPPTRHRLVFVPLDDAVAGPRYLKVSYDKAMVKKAPSLATDGILLAENEEGIFQYYDKPYQTGADGERQLARR